MFAFTPPIAMATVTMEILRSFVKHHFLIVFVAVFNQTIKKTIYSGQKKLRNYSLVFIATKLVAVYLYKASMFFFLRSGWLAGQRPTERQKCPKTMFSKKCPFLRLILTSFARDMGLNVLHKQMSSQLGCHGNGDMGK